MQDKNLIVCGKRHYPFLRNILLKQTKERQRQTFPTKNGMQYMGRTKSAVIMPDKLCDALAFESDRLTMLADLENKLEELSE